MTVAIVGLPGGLEPRHDQLKELVKAGRIAAYEVPAGPTSTTPTNSSRGFLG